MRFDAIVIGGGHNGLVAATLLARAGRSVLVLERSEQLGGAAVSGIPFAGLPARVSRYSYLVSLFPRALIAELGLDLELRVRRVASYTPQGDGGLLLDRDASAITGWNPLQRMLGRAARRLFGTLTEPLLSREQLRLLLDDELAWQALFEEPLSALLERTLPSDLARGIALTDGLIGTFAAADDPQLRQNRCFLYHVIGNGSGRWDVPVGGMGALSAALASVARSARVNLRTGTEVISVKTDGEHAEVRCAGGAVFAAEHVLAGVAPAVLSRLLGEPAREPPPEGSQLKLNMLLRRLPALRDPSVSPEGAFTGTFHVNEGYGQLQRAYEEADAGSIPTLPPCELYCHSLTDPSILSDGLRAAGAHTLTLFALHMPARLFAGAPGGSEPGTGESAKAEAVAAVLRSVDSVLAEPLEDCLWRAADGTQCLDALTPPELEAELGMPGGHIFHRDLAWPFAETEAEIGTWGAETHHPNVWLCGAGARRGGGVSGIPGHNAARAVLAAGRRRGGRDIRSA